MNAVDSSVIVAGFASWHEAHAAARRALAAHPALIAHCGLESYSVLTRLPAPHRAPAALVAEFLAAWFPKPPLVLPAHEAGKLVARLAAEGVVGGAAYDALVGLTAAYHGATLLSLDVRAEATYRRLGVAHRQLG